MLALPQTMKETVRSTLTKRAEVAGQMVSPSNGTLLSSSPIASEQTNATSLERGVS